MSTSPGSLGATSLMPVSISTTRISTSGMGMPTEPCFHTPLAGVAVMASVPSVNPYPSVIGPLIRASKLVLVSVMSGAAPDAVRRRDLRSSGFRSG